MDFPQPLVRGRLVQRYKRFFADVVLDDGQEITAHCPNPGAMLGLNAPGLPAWLSRSDDPKRKLAHTLELVEVDGGLVGINTMHPNRLVAEALANGTIAEVAGLDNIRREVKYGDASRVDFLLEDGDDRRHSIASAVRPPRPVWLEVKGVTLSRSPGVAEWPDCRSDRGARHVRELAAKVAAGDRAVVLFVVQRSDCKRFAVCRELDPAFADALEEAQAAGLEVLAYDCELSPGGITLSRRLSIG